MIIRKSNEQLNFSLGRFFTRTRRTKMSKSKDGQGYLIPTNIKVRGATAPDGKPYVEIRASGRRCWIPREAFAGGAQRALRMAEQVGMPFLNPEWKLCKKAVDALTAYPQKALINRPGWNGSRFALPDGTVFSNGDCKPIVLFPMSTERCCAAGSLKEWKRLTALLRDQSVATFILLTAFAGPLIQFSHQLMNVGFELAGSGGKGKSTALRIAAAVCGPADSPEGSNYWITAHATLNGLESVLAEHSDMPLIIDETNLYAAADLVGKRAAKFNQLVFWLSEGAEKRRFFSEKPLRSRFTYLTAANEPLGQVLIGYRVPVAEAAADRLNTIPIDDARPHGIFDTLPNGFESGAQFAEYLNMHIRRIHGVGIRRFLKKLVTEVNVDREAFVCRFQKSVKSFRADAGVDGSNGSEARVADSFGLVAAAGDLAVKYGAVSKYLNPRAAALACYRLNRAGPRAIDPVEKLIDLADSFGVWWVDHDKLRPVSTAELENFDGILYHGANGRRELLLTPKQLMRAFPDTRAFNAHPAIRNLRIAEPGRKQTKRKVRSNSSNDRFHVFRIDHLMD